MRVTLTVKILGLVAFGVVTSIVTSAVAAQIRQAKKQQPPAPPTSVAVAAPPQELNQRRQPPVGSIASGGLNSFGVEVEGNIVHCIARSYLRDSRPNMQYVWVLRVFSADDKKKTKILYEKIYHEQVFTMQPQGEMAPTFEDAIELSLPRAPYLLELTLNMIPPNVGLEGLRNAAMAEELRGPTGTRKIVVGR